MRKLVPFILCSSLSVGCAAADEGCEAKLPLEESCVDENFDTKEDNLCLEVEIQGDAAIEAARLAVVWVQLQSMDKAPEPQIAADLEFDPKAELVSVPWAEIQPPQSDALALCERTCVDATCACADGSAVHTATLVVAKDSNRDGRLTVEEVRQGSIGRAYMMVAHSETEQNIAPPPADQLFTGGLVRGTAAYRFIGNPEERPELVPAKPGETFTLNVCAEARCEPAFPTIRIE